MTETSNCEMDIYEFNQQVINAHNAHYVDGQHKLIDKSTTASPNENQIYHLYSNGEITYQKGAWAYLQRSEFNMEYEITGASQVPFKFVKKTAEGTTYAILTKPECLKFREDMKKYIISK